MIMDNVGNEDDESILNQSLDSCDVKNNDISESLIAENTSSVSSPLIKEDVDVNSLKDANVISHQAVDNVENDSFNINKAEKCGTGRGRGKKRAVRKKRTILKDSSDEDFPVGRLGETVRKARAAAKKSHRDFKNTKVDKTSKLVGPYLISDEKKREDQGSSCNDLVEIETYRVVNPLPSRADNCEFGGSSGSAIRLQIPQIPPDAPFNGMDPRGIWCCVFCGKTSQFMSLGPLYGPYFLPIASLNELPKECLFSIDMENGNSSNYASTVKVKINDIHRNVILVSKKERIIPKTGEFWTHVECALWAPGTYFDGLRLDGWSDAVPLALRCICSSCKLLGAVVGCSERGCTRAYHYLCATLTEDVELQSETFCLRCAEHNKK